jgi:hypothetical protein
MIENPHTGWFEILALGKITLQKTFYFVLSADAYNLALRHICRIRL